MSSGGRLGRWLACSQRSPRVLECLYGRPARRARCLPSSSSPSSRPSSSAASASPPSGHPSPAEMSSTCTKLASRLSRLVSPSAPSPRGSAPTSGCALLIGTPFRESGPPACMAKLIMLRHKVSPPCPRFEVAPPRLILGCALQIQQDNTKRRNHTSQARRVSRTFNASPARSPRNVPWVRFGRAYGKQNY